MGDQPIDIAGIKATCSNIKDQSSCTANSNCEWGSTINFQNLENSIINPIKYCLHATDLSIDFTDFAGGGPSSSPSSFPSVTPTCKYTGPVPRTSWINCDLILLVVQAEIDKYNSKIQTDLQNFLQSQSTPAKDGKPSPDSALSDILLNTLNNEFAKINTTNPSSTVIENFVRVPARPAQQGEGGLDTVTLMQEREDNYKQLPGAAPVAKIPAGCPCDGTGGGVYETGCPTNYPCQGHLNPLLQYTYTCMPAGLFGQCSSNQDCAGDVGCQAGYCMAPTGQDPGPVCAKGLVTQTDGCLCNGPLYKDSGPHCPEGWYCNGARYCTNPKGLVPGYCAPPPTPPPTPSPPPAPKPPAPTTPPAPTPPPTPPPPPAPPAVACPPQTKLNNINCDQYIASGAVPPRYNNCAYLKKYMGVDCHGCRCSGGAKPPPSPPPTPAPTPGPNPSGIDPNCYFWDGQWWEPDKCRDKSTTKVGSEGGCKPTSASKALGLTSNAFDTPCGAANDGLPPTGLGLCTPCQSATQNCDNIPGNPIIPIPTTCNIPSIIESFFTEFEPIFVEILNSEVQTQMLANFPLSVDLSAEAGIKIQVGACSNWLYPKTLSINNVPSDCGPAVTAGKGCGGIAGPAQITLDNTSIQVGTITWTPATEVPFTLSLTATLQPINIDATMTLDVRRVTEMPGPIQMNCLGECLGGPGEQCCGEGGCCAYVLLGQDETERTAPYIAASIPITISGTFKLKNQTDLNNLGACISIDSLDLSLNPTFSVTSGQFAFKVSDCNSVMVGASAWVFDYVIAKKMSWWQNLVTNIVAGSHPLLTGAKVLPLLQSALGSFKC